MSVRLPVKDMIIRQEGVYVKGADWSEDLDDALAQNVLHVVEKET